MLFSIQHGCEDHAIILCPQPQKGFLYALLSMVIQLLWVAPSRALATPNELFSALQSATRFFPVHSICYLITSTGLSLLAAFSLYQVPFLRHSCVCYPLYVYYI